MAKITKRSEDYAKWYTDVVLQAELADYAPVKGCMVVRPNGYAIWEKMRDTLDKMFKDTGHRNAYFPLFIPESFFKREAEHVEGFAPECAIVTHGGGKKLEEPLYVRPTSETIIWYMYKKWISSYRDLPILYNQWANVVRWEMRTRLFLRTTEFLWQEGHTAHATDQEALEETMTILELYKEFAENYMSMPVITGQKTDSEKFAGAVNTYSIEAMMQDRRALQAGTSHYLGQNFAKAFDVTFLDPKGDREYVYATSWGVSTRLIGGLIMTHSDDQGLVIPPRLAPLATVIVPIWKNDEEKSKVLEVSNRIAADVKSSLDISCHIDDRDQFSPGWKFNEWELRGVPLRVEVGPRDVESGSAVLVRRDNREKTQVRLAQLLERIPEILDEMQSFLFRRAFAFRDENRYVVDSYDEFRGIFEDLGGFVYAFWCGEQECETRISEETKATIRNIPLDPKKEKGHCILCGRPAEVRVPFAKAY